jgi:TatD DNase family protein
MFDSHCHLDFDELSAQVEDHLEEARLAGVRGWFVPGCRPNDGERLSLVKQTNVWVGVGLHPYFTEEEGDIDSLSSRLERAAQSLGAVAIGECGLDKNKGADAHVQVSIFEAQLRLARDLELPIVMHQVGHREAFLNSLKRVGVPTRGGVVHGFGGDTGWGRALVKLGLHLGLGPAITRESRAKLRAAAAELPVERLLIETDAPDQRPSGRVGIGRPADLLEVCRALGALRGCSMQEIARRTEQSARALYGLKRADF